MAILTTIRNLLRRQRPTDRSDDELDDGFGNIAIRCRSPKCDLQIVRPGKFQCSDYCDEAGWD